MNQKMLGYIVPIGILFVFVGIITILIGSILLTDQKTNNTAEDRPKIHIGVGGFIGPIPFGFANSKTALYITIGAAAFFFILWLILRYAKI